jgi:anti-sigma regulatory factor (Ser/Thr protein kinase)
VTVSVLQLSISVTADAESVAVVRHYVEAARLELGCAVDPDILALLTSELVANAVDLGAGEIMVTVRCEESRLRVEVRDHGYGMPEVLHPRPFDSDGGRGLMIVERLADHWGVQQFLPGKIVWFEMEPLLVGDGMARRETMPG